MRQQSGSRGDENMNIVYKSRDAVVVIKPVGMPSQSDPTGDTDAMTATAEQLRSCGEPSSLWQIHRLDRGVGGLMVFARSSRAAAVLSEAVRDRKMEKRYLAVVDGRPEGGVLEDLLFKDSRTSKAYIADRERAGVKRAILEYRPLATVTVEGGERTLVLVGLKTGRFHQIRVQFASRRHPLVGDKKYGSRDRGTGGIALFCCGLSFDNCDIRDKSGKRIALRTLPELDKYPWNLFDWSAYEYDDR